MGTSIRPEVSERSKYWLERHRYYELKHFCLQYHVWKKALSALEGLTQRGFGLAGVGGGEIGDPTGKSVEARAFFFERISMVERVARETEASLAGYILAGVTEGMSYEDLRTRKDVPCCKDVYYTLYRKFFWLLNRERE